MGYETVKIVSSTCDKYRNFSFSDNYVLCEVKCQFDIKSVLYNNNIFMISFNIKSRKGGI